MGGFRVDDDGNRRQVILFLFMHDWLVSHSENYFESGLLDVSGLTFQTKLIVIGLSIYVEVSKAKITNYNVFLIGVMSLWSVSLVGFHL